MRDNWRKRLQQIVDERDLEMKNLSLASGLKDTAVRDWLKRGKTPLIDNFAAVARTLGLTVGQLYDGEEGVFQTIPIIGAAIGGESWEPIDDGLGDVQLKIEEGEPVGLEVRGDSMTPAYRPGDIIFGAKRSANLESFVGMDCIIQTVEGLRCVKYLQRGIIKDRFNLQSYNPGNRPIENAKVEWAAPILWVRRHWS